MRCGEVSFWLLNFVGFLSVLLWKGVIYTENHRAGNYSVVPLFNSVKEYHLPRT